MLIESLTHLTLPSPTLHDDSNTRSLPAYGGIRIVVGGRAPLALWSLWMARSTCFGFFVHCERGVSASRVIEVFLFSTDPV
jgi:hypothetical protein